MTRIGKALVAAMLVLPAVAQAQRPGNTLQTRSAELYLDRAEKANHDDEKAKLYKQAMDMATQAVQKEPNNPKTWFVLGRVDAATGDALGADSAFTKAETMYPDYVKETDIERQRAYVNAFNAGVTAIQKNDIESAIKNMEAASAVYHKKPAAPLNLANVYLRANQPEKAAGALKKALAILQGPERKTITPAEEKQWAQWEDAAVTNLANILANSGKLDESIETYKSVVARDPNNVQAKINIALLYSQAGKHAEAKAVYSELLQQDLPADEFFRAGVGLYRAEDYPDAITAFQKAVAKNPVFRDAWFNLAESYYSQLLAFDQASGVAPAGTYTVVTVAGKKLCRDKAGATVAMEKCTGKPMDAQQKAVYQSLRDASEKLYALDPANRTTLKLLAMGYKGMADAAATPAEAEPIRNKLMDLLEKIQKMPLEVTDLAIDQAKDTARVSGKLVNVAATAGDPVAIAVQLLKTDGTVLSTDTVRVAAPAVDASTPFKFTRAGVADAAGAKYTVIYEKPKPGAK